MDIPKYNSPLNTTGGISGVLGGHKFKSLGKLSNGCTDWHQIWYTSADSSGNGHRLNTIRPTIPQGHWGGFRGSQIQMFGNLSNDWTDWHKIWFTSADSSGNGHRLNTSRPTIPRGHFGGVLGVTNSNVWGSCQTARPIGTKFGKCLRIHLGLDIAKYNSPLNTTVGILGGFKGSQI